MKKRNTFWKKRVTFLLAAALLAGEVSGAALTVQATGATSETTETEKVEQTVPVPKEYISLNDDTREAVADDMTPENGEAGESEAVSPTMESIAVTTPPAITLGQFESPENSNDRDVELACGEEKWVTFTPQEDGRYAIIVSCRTTVGAYKENTEENLLDSISSGYCLENDYNNYVVTLEKDETYYFSLYKNTEENYTETVRLVKLEDVTVDENGTASKATYFGVNVSYEAPEAGIYQVSFTGEKSNYSLGRGKEIKCAWTDESIYFYCTSGVNEFYIFQNDNDFGEDNISVEISKATTRELSKEVTMTESEIWLKYTVSEAGKYTFGSNGAVEDGWLRAMLYVQNEENELEYLEEFSEEEGTDFRGSYSLEEGIYYILLRSDTVPNTFDIYVNSDVIMQGSLGSEKDVSITKTARFDFDYASMTSGFLHVSLKNTSGEDYWIGFADDVSDNGIMIDTEKQTECDVYISDSIINRARKKKQPVSLMVVKFGAPSAKNIKVTIAKAEPQAQEITLNQTIQVEGSSTLDSYSFKPVENGYYKFMAEGIDEFYYYNESATMGDEDEEIDFDRCSTEESVSLNAGDNYIFYVKNVEKKPYSLCMKQMQNFNVYDYDSYQAFIASGGTINLMNVNDISEELWENLWDGTDYSYDYIDSDKVIVTSTADFHDASNKWMLYCSDWVETYKPVNNYQQVYDKLMENKYVNYWNEFLPEPYIFKNLCDENGNPITADAALYNEHIVFVNYAPEYVYIQNITLQGVNALKTGETATLKANISTGNKYAPTDSTLTWTSSDNSVVTVDNQGNMKGIKAGTATITCTANDELHKSASLKVTVTETETVVYAAKVVISGSNTVNVGETITLTATIDTNGKGKPSRDGVSWSSNNTSVATVDAKGVVTGVKAGTAVITATSMDGKAKADYTITVKNVEAKKISLNESKLTMKKGTTYKWLEVTFTPKNTTDKKLTWKSSNTKVATVTSDGKIKAKTTGEAVITVKSSNGKKDTVKVTVQKSNVKAKKVKIPSKETMMEGEKLKLTPEFTPVNTTNKKIKWNSSNDNIATVSQKGVVTAKKAGKVTITVTTKDGSKKSSKCTITVKELDKVKGLKVTSDSKKTVTLSWNEVKDASGYNIYMSTSKKGTYKKIGTTKAGVLTFTKKGLTSKKKNYFKVVAFKKNNGKQYEGKYSTVKSVKIK